MATKGDVRREDFLWKEGMPNWVLAAKVNGLFPILSNSLPNEPTQSSTDSRTTNSTLKSQVASTVPTNTSAGVTPNTPELASDEAWIVDQAEVPLVPLAKGTHSMSTGTVLLIVAGVGFGLLVVCGGIGTALFLPARETARQNQNKNNLKQIGLAMHNYHEMHEMFPSGGIVREDGTEMLSWTASIIPFLDHAELYSQINPDFGWNSPQNQTVFSTTIPSLLNPGILEKTGPGICHYAGNSHLFKINTGVRIAEITDTRQRWVARRELRQLNTGVSFADITDGTSNTILVGEVSAGFKQWGDPTNVRDPGLGLGKTPDQFGSPFQGGAHFVMGDGSVRFISENIDRDVLKALATPDEGDDAGEFASSVKLDGWIRYTADVYKGKSTASEKVGVLTSPASVGVADDGSGWLRLIHGPIQEVGSNRFSDRFLDNPDFDSGLYIKAGNFTTTIPGMW